MNNNYSIKNRIITLIEDLRIKARKRHEILKFKDKRRMSISADYKLTNEQLQEIDTLYVNCYGKKIPYTWHRHYTAFTGQFDAKYFPELLYIPEFELFMNPKPEYNQVFADKNVLPLIASSIGVKMPKTVISCCEGMYRDSQNRAISIEVAIDLLRNSKGLFAKPTIDSCSGRGCSRVSFTEGMNEDGVSTKIVLENLGRNFVVQEAIKCHETIRKLHPNSVNTFRIITYRWNNDICFMPALMRIGKGGSSLDNAHAGGIFISVDSNGKLGDIARTEFKDEFKIHPTTGVVFKEYQIPLFKKVLDAAKIMHEAIPQVGTVNWDFTIDETGEPVLIEANTQNGSIWLVEMSHGCGGFGEHTESVLKWLRFVKQKNAEERKKYGYGKTK